MAKQDVKVGNYSDDFPLLASLDRGYTRLAQLGYGALRGTVGRVPGTIGDIAREMADEGVARKERRLQAIPRNEDRAWDNPGILPKITHTLDVMAESLPVAAPAIAATAATAGAGTVPMLAALGAASGATEYNASVDDYLRQQGVDLADAAQIMAAHDNPELMGAAREYAAKRGAVVGAADAATLGISKGAAGALLRSGRPVAAAGAGLAIEGAGGGVGEAGAQLATDGQVTDWAAVRDEVLGELLPGGAQVAAATLASPRQTAQPLPTEAQSVPPSFDPGAAPPGAPAPVDVQPAATPAPKPFADTNGFDPDAYLAEVNQNVPGPAAPAPRPQGPELDPRQLTRQELANPQGPATFDSPTAQARARLAYVEAVRKGQTIDQAIDAALKAKQAAVGGAQMPQRVLDLVNELYQRQLEVSPLDRPASPDAAPDRGFDIQGLLDRINREVASPQPGPNPQPETNGFDPDAFLGRLNTIGAQVAQRASLTMQNTPVQSVPVADIQLSKDVPNFKEGSNATTGEVQGNEIKAGAYIEVPVKPITVWQRLDGRKEIITGRHRLALARRLGKADIPAQIVREADGFTKEQAVIWDAEDNIRDGQGTSRDFAHYFRNAVGDRADAVTRGLIRGDQGEQGAAIGFDATPPLYDLYRNRRLSEPKTAAIARAAPQDERMQQVAIRAALDDKSLTAEDLSNLVQAVRQAMAGTQRPQGQQLDLFGRDDSAMKEMVATSKAASRIQAGIAERLNTIRAGKKLSEGDRAALARELGINVQTGNLAATQATLQAEADRWTRWATDPDLVRAARERAKLPVSKPVAKSFKGGTNEVAAPQQSSAAETLVGFGKPAAGDSNVRSTPPNEGSSPANVGSSTPNIQPTAPNSGSTPAGVAPNGQAQLLGQDVGGLTLTGERVKPAPVDPERQAREAEEAQRRFREANSQDMFGGVAAPINAIPRDFDPTPPAQVRFGINTASGQPVGKGDIMRFIASAFDVPIRYGNLVMKADGYYQTFRESIRLRKPGMVPTAFHELGHYLHNVLFPGNPSQDARGTREQEYSSFAGRFDSELLPLGTRTSAAGYTPQQVRMEGVAEWLREYMDDPASAYARAPGFSAHFRAEIEKIPDLAEAIDKVSTMVWSWKTQGPLMRLLAQIRSGADRLKSDGPRAFLRRAYTSIVDENAPIFDMLDTLVDAGADPAAAQNIRAMIVNRQGGLTGKVEHSLHKASLDLDGKEVGDSYETILKRAKEAVAGKDLKGLTWMQAFASYAIAKHAQVDLHPRNIRTGLLQKDVDFIVGEYDSHFRPILLQLVTWQRQQRDLVVQAGVLSAEAAKAMDDKHMFYVPFHRYFDGGKASGGVKGKGLVNLESGIRAIKGSEREILNPLETMIANAHMFRRIAEANKIGLEMVDFVMNERGGGRIGDPVAKKMVPTKVGTKDIVAVLKQSGADPSLIQMVETAGPEGQIWKAAHAVNTRDMIFRVWRNGKDEHYQFDDPELYNAIANADSDDLAVLKNLHPFLSGIGQISRTFTNIKRAGATLSPNFTARGFVRDQMTAFIHSKGFFDYIPIYDAVKGMRHVIQKTPEYWQWKAAGGSGATMNRPEQVIKSVDQLLPSASVVEKMASLLNPKNVYRGLVRLAEVSEESTRVKYFLNRLARGDSEIEAANASKEITLNFSRGGKLTRMANRHVAFLNASVQDTDRLIKQLGDPKTYWKQHVKRLLLITPLSIAAILAKEEGDEEDKRALDQLPDYQRTYFWNFRVKGVTVTIPKPFIEGHLFGTAIEEGYEQMRRDDPNAVARWVRYMNNMLPAGGVSEYGWPSGLMPDIMQTFWEVQTNYSRFREGPIVPQRLENLPKELQADSRTSSVAKFISSTLGAVPGLGSGFRSPIMVDHMISQTFSGLGKHGTDAIDFIAAKLYRDNLPPPVAKRWWEVTPGVKAYFVSPFASSRYTGEFYQGYNNFEKVMAAGSKITPQDTVWLKKHGEELNHYTLRAKTLRAMMRQMSELTKARRQVEQAMDIKPEEKRRRVLALIQAQSDQARQAIDAKLFLPKDLYESR